LAGYLGGDVSDRRMELTVTARERLEADRVLTSAGVDVSTRKPWILLNPGAQFGAAKLWLPEYYAKLADDLGERLGATVLVSAAPNEREIVAGIRQHAQRPFVDLSAHCMTLGALKTICGRID